MLVRLYVPNMLSDIDMHALFPSFEHNFNLIFFHADRSILFIVDFSVSNARKKKTRMGVAVKGGSLTCIVWMLDYNISLFRITRLSEKDFTCHLQEMLQRRQ